MRVLTTAILLTGMGFVAHVLTFAPSSKRELLSAFTIAILCAGLLPAVFFVTEPESLGRRVAPRIPRSRALAVLCTPYLPGGGRGVMLFFGHLGLTLLFLLVMQLTALPLRGGSFLADGVGAVFGMALYATIYLLLPSGLLSRFSGRMPMRVLVRALIPVLVIFFVFAPSLLGFFVDSNRLMEMKHAGNPVFMLGSFWNAARLVYPGYWVLLLSLFGAALVLNARRVVRGLLEVLEARRQRLRDERARAAWEPAAAGEPDPPSDLDAVPGA
jgi:hypothetical protein